MLDPAADLYRKQGGRYCYGRWHGDGYGEGGNQRYSYRLHLGYTRSCTIRNRGWVIDLTIPTGNVSEYQAYVIGRSIYSIFRHYREGYSHESAVRTLSW